MSARKTVSASLSISLL